MDILKTAKPNPGINRRLTKKYKMESTKFIAPFFNEDFFGLVPGEFERFVSKCCDHDGQSLDKNTANELHREACHISSRYNATMDTFLGCVSSYCSRVAKQVRPWKISSDRCTCRNIVPQGIDLLYAARIFVEDQDLSDIEACEIPSDYTDLSEIFAMCLREHNIMVCKRKGNLDMFVPLLDQFTGNVFDLLDLLYNAGHDFAYVSQRNTGERYFITDEPDNLRQALEEFVKMFPILNAQYLDDALDRQDDDDTEEALAYLFDFAGNDALDKLYTGDYFYMNIVDFVEEYIEEFIKIDYVYHPKTKTFLHIIEHAND